MHKSLARNQKQFILSGDGKRKDCILPENSIHQTEPQPIERKE